MWDNLEGAMDKNFFCFEPSGDGTFRIVWFNVAVQRTLSEKVPELKTISNVSLPNQVSRKMLCIQAMDAHRAFNLANPENQRLFDWDLWRSADAPGRTALEMFVKEQRELVKESQASLS